MRLTALNLAIVAFCSTAVIALPTETPPPAVCLAICYFEKPDCGKDGFPQKQGECWTCCRNQTPPPPPPPVCLAICYFEKPDCGKDGFPKKEGECWTCCRDQTPPPPNDPGCPAHY